MISSYGIGKPAGFIGLAVGDVLGPCAAAGFHVEILSRTTRISLDLRHQPERIRLVVTDGLIEQAWWG
ncbi:hypothetical protein SAMN05421630_110227 [Prauserella marina]|uniref:Uncharacterized protein n=1 Tax=Prauserella marina TaxID=530584 RepID=A0A1G6W9S4_9PSEU|nr:hypothetical protein [Prauserella marina]PWV74052.1 hypothetical protein DES30_108226 [Prauserella marina]SDD61795.1 hypothetical protein SAMN05421630_110227 [Prauserella marina]